MIVRDCMTKNVALTDPDSTLRAAAQKMRDGDFGSLPVGENDRLIGMITDRDIAFRAVAEGKDPGRTKVREVMSKRVLYCYEDQDMDEVTRNMGDNQVRRLPVLNRSKRMVGILSLADIAKSQGASLTMSETLAHISEPLREEPLRWASA
ncbi:MAG: CBS domain-containing protein [Bdellovibrionota bacterium]